MPQEIYKELAQKLDSLPNRFPATESGIELRILEKIFSLEEATLAAAMTFNKDTYKEIALRAGIEEKRTRQMLKNMVRRGLIVISRSDRGLVYGLMPFVVGFYEEHLPHYDKEFAELMEVYFQEVKGGITGKGLSVNRIIPVEESIEFEMEIYPYEKASDLIENAKSWGVRDCICRVHKNLIGDPCDHPVESCLIFSPFEGAFDYRVVDREITKEEALQKLHDAEKAGLVHTTGNFQEPISYLPYNYICNCCTCSCGILRSIAEFNRSTAIAKSDFLAVVDQDLCIACGDCLERCQFGAMELGELICEIIPDNCVGCGLCVQICPEDALVLIRRPEGEVGPPPEDFDTWSDMRFRM